MTDNNQDECLCDVCTGEQPTREEQEAMLAELGMVGIADDFSVHTLKFEWCEDCNEMHGKPPEGVHLLTIMSREDLMRMRHHVNDYTFNLVAEQGPMALLATPSRALN